MRDPKRIGKILKELEKVWKTYPEQRLGQILENYVFFEGERGDTTSVRLFYQEDGETLKCIKAFLEERNPELLKEE